MINMIKIFISYSHDSEDHKRRVLELANQLRGDGLDCTIDQYEESPPEGWPKWMETHLRTANFVLVVCTQTYLNRVYDMEREGIGLGAKFESSIVYQYIYQDDAKNRRFIPVVFQKEDFQYIPTLLKKDTCYCVTDFKEYKALYRRLTSQPLVKKPIIGPVIQLDSKEVPLLFPNEVKKAGNRKGTNSSALPEHPLSKRDYDQVSAVNHKKKAIKISVSKLPVTSSELFGREKDLSNLDRSWWEKNTGIVILVAWGGVGKTALVNRWLLEMKKKDYYGARRVYGWSFYSQGTGEGKQTSADLFIQETLYWFGDPDPKEGTAVQKGRRLAELIRKEKTLLILDGIEPLQYPPKQDCSLDGQLKDQGLKTLLKEIAADMDGLCVVTTREKVTDLKGFHGISIKEVELDNLSIYAGVELLTYLDVCGSIGELEEAVTEYGGHALALNLLGNFLATVHNGDIRKRDLIPRLTDEKEQGRHAQRVMVSYEHLMISHTKWKLLRRLGLFNRPTPELQILYLMGLFDRPATGRAIEALKKEPAIQGLTDRLLGLSCVDWQFALKRLQRLGLLAYCSADKKDCPDIDCHPLIREYFGSRLKHKHPRVWRRAHTRLYHYYKNLPEKEFPDTLEELEPLFAAVTHGCEAGRHQETLTEVYWKRIHRKEENYVVKKLGAVGADLAAVSHFYDTLWTHPARCLKEFWKAAVLNWVGFRLRALGRLHEAVKPITESLEKFVKLKDWEEAAMNANNLSALQQTLGRLEEGVKKATLSVKYADQSKDVSHRVSKRTVLAEAMHQCGNVKEAEQIFREAEEIAKGRQLEYPYLYSQWGYRYCDFLLDQGRYSEVMERAEQTLEWGLQHGALIDVALDNLSLGRALLMQAQESRKEGDWHRVSQHLDQAVDGLREAGQIQYLASGLIYRSAYYRLQQDYVNAGKDLSEAREIIEQAGMKLYMADYHLEAARLCRDGDREDEAAEHKQKAGELIKEMKYFRRKNELKSL